MVFISHDKNFKNVTSVVCECLDGAVKLLFFYVADIWKGIERIKIRLQFYLLTLTIQQVSIV